MRKKVIVSTTGMFMLLVAAFVISRWNPSNYTEKSNVTDVEKKTAAVQEDPEIQVVMMENKDVQDLISVVYAVSGDLSFETQICVTRLLLNRVGSDNYPNLLSEVITEFAEEDIREAKFDSSLDNVEYAEILDEAHDITKEAVNVAISDKSNTIKLPSDVTILSIHELDRFEEWTSDCVDGLRFYFE